MNPEYKQCSKCHQLKLVTEFVRKKQCKSCISAYHAAYRAANRERRSAYDAANRERIKAYRDSYRAGKTKNHRTTHFFQTLLLASKQQQNKTP